ncbi:MAG TPA: hypothetical protein PK854_01310 [Oscillospiraceae bacterium]|nr:hypothetical protein [Oscillospiraceae bacterium]HPS33889.1 hypothetical protein [Oscillospiraceae bacterium]
MIYIKHIEKEDGQFYWIAEDADGMIGQIAVKAGPVPVITQLEFEQFEIGDGLIKTAAVFFADAGVSKMRFSVTSDKAVKAAAAVGFLKTENGLELNPAHAIHSCGGN